MAEWAQIKSIEMLVSQAEQSLSNNSNNNLIISCNLLNIARGRCQLTLNKKDDINKNEDLISISSEKPIMKAVQTLSEEQYKNFLASFYNYAQYKIKKIKIILYIDKPIAIDNDGFLNIEKDSVLFKPEERYLNGWGHQAKKDADKSLSMPMYQNKELLTVNKYIDKELLAELSYVEPKII